MNTVIYLRDGFRQISRDSHGRMSKTDRKRAVFMLGTRIAILRHKANLSQKKLAERLHISPSTVGMYEQGGREPSIHILAAIAHEFDVTIDYLVLGCFY